MPTPKTVRNIFKSTPAFTAELQQAAERADITASEYIRQAVEEKMKKDTRKQAKEREGR